MNNKETFVKNLENFINENTRENVNLVLEDNGDTLIVNGTKINIACDSNIAIMIDLFKQYKF